MRGAAVLQYMEMPQFLGDAGRGAVLLHQQVERRAVDRSLLLRQEDRAWEGSAYLQPGAERPRFLTHEVVMAGIGTLEPVDKNPISFGIIIAELEHADLRRSQAGAVGELEDGAIAHRVDD